MLRCPGKKCGSGKKINHRGEKMGIIMNFTVKQWKPQSTMGFRELVSDGNVNA